MVSLNYRHLYPGTKYTKLFVLIVLNQLILKNLIYASLQYYLYEKY
jgi:hypothetical protein